jgi:hypothetical protein
MSAAITPHPRTILFGPSRRLLAKGPVLGDGSTSAGLATLGLLGHFSPETSGWIAGVAVAGIYWISVWLEPQTPAILTVCETQPYTVVGLNGIDLKPDLTESPYLKITSSDVGALKIDRKNAAFIGKKPDAPRFGFHSAKPRPSFRRSSKSRRPIRRQKERNRIGRPSLRALSFAGPPRGIPDLPNCVIVK